MAKVDERRSVHRTDHAGAWWPSAAGVLAASTLVVAATVVVIALGGQLAVVDPVVALSALAAVLLLVGLARGGARHPWGLSVQVAAMAGVLAVALLAVTAPEPWGAVLLAGGLLAHTGWDLIHRRNGRVVPRSMAEFCAVLDALLAAGVLVLAFT